jgi:hypothetical protein
MDLRSLAGSRWQMFPAGVPRSIAQLRARRLVMPTKVGTHACCLPKQAWMAGLRPTFPAPDQPLQHFHPG